MFRLIPAFSHVPVFLNCVTLCRSISRKVPMTKFCANLSFMYHEHGTLSERYLAAAKFGFKGVEICFPYDTEVEELKKAAIIDTILINSYPGQSFGFAAIPGKQQDFKDSIDKSLQYVDALGVKRLHIMSGVTSGLLDTTREECYEVLEQNLLDVLPALEQRNVVGLIEPINNKTIPGYFLNNYIEALNLIKKIDSPFLRLQLDIFHLQQIQGNLSAFIQEAMPFVGHVQIAQVPNRDEPDSEDGEINYPYILNLLLRRYNYSQWIGLEYKPKDTLQGLGWIKKYSFDL